MKKRFMVLLLSVSMALSGIGLRVEAGEESGEVISGENSVSSGDAFDGCEHEWSVVDYDENQHTLQCKNCQQEKTESHTLTGDKFFGMDVCTAGCVGTLVEAGGQPENPEDTEGSCQHDWVLVNYDLDNHLQQCSKCEEEKTEPHEIVGEFLGLDVCIAGCVVANENQEEPEHPVEESFPIESYYAARGAHGVRCVEFASGEDNFEHYKIWYPADLETSGGIYPVIAMANGTGCAYNQESSEEYIEHFEHMASWGFVVAANDDVNSFMGESTLKSTQFLLSLNENPESIFYGKIDTKKIGVTGHSQGGAGAINAATGEGGEIFSSVFSASAANVELTMALEWGSYDMSKITVPCCLIAAETHPDVESFELLVAPLESLQANYAGIPESVPAVMMRRINFEHGDTLKGCDGYLTAWFLYTLLSDGNAAGAFCGEGAEIYNNTNWVDVSSKNLIAVKEANENPNEVPDEVETGGTGSNALASDKQIKPAMRSDMPMNMIQALAKTVNDCIDTRFYEAQYPDLQQAFQENEKMLKNHFWEYGLNEKRVAIPFLDIVGYREIYPDLENAFGDDWDAYLQHYFKYGAKEGRISGTYFDAAIYAERYEDLMDAFGYDVIKLYNHYVIYGRKEGRNPTR